jgi:hypothetical protein
MSPNAGGGGVAGVSANENSRASITWHGAQLNFGDLTPYLTPMSRSRSRSSDHGWVMHAFIGSVVESEPEPQEP